VQSLPNPPTAFHGTVASHEIIADWSAPTVVGSAPIASYTVTAAVLGHKYTCTTTKTTCTVAGLTNGLSYAVTVTARSIEGISAASATSMVVPTSSTKLATAPPFVAAVGEPFVVPVTGVAPGSAVTVTATYATGSATCVAGSFGQCEATMTLTNTSKTTVSASQTVAHVKVHAPTTTARVATLSAIPPSMNYDHQLTVSINDGVPNEVFEVTTAEGFTTTPKTDSNGNANAYVSFPLAQQYCLVTVYQDGDLLEQGMTQIL
jgi:hypothetical protein